jgi:hypothetical protein
MLRILQANMQGFVGDVAAAEEYALTPDQQPMTDPCFGKFCRRTMFYSFDDIVHLLPNDHHVRWS